MKITIKNIIKEDNNKVERYIYKVSQILQKPYIYNLKSMDVPMEYWDDILSNIFNEPVKWKKPGGILFILDMRNNILYEESEREDGIRWERQIVDHKNNLVFYEDSRGVWEKIDYDYYENGGVLRKQIEGSDGYWSISEWDKDGERIYFSDSKGELIDKRSTNNINESVEDKKEKYIYKISQIIRKPYIVDLKRMDVPEEYWGTIFKIIFNQKNVKIEYTVYESNRIKYTIYDSKTKHIFYSEGPKEGIWSTQEYDSNGNVIYYDNSDGLWEKREYDSNGNEIFTEYSDGYWTKIEYDSDGNLIYYENSDGEINDLRPNTNINESVEDKKETFINKVVDMLMSITEFIPIKNEKGFTTQVEVIWPMYSNSEIMGKNDIDYYINYLSVWELSEVEIKYIYDMFGIEDQRLIQTIFDKYGQKSHTIINNMLNS